MAFEAGDSGKAARFAIRTGNGRNEYGRRRRLFKARIPQGRKEAAAKEDKPWEGEPFPKSGWFRELL
jgi:hypothetical protein